MKALTKKKKNQQQQQQQSKLLFMTIFDGALSYLMHISGSRERKVESQDDNVLILCRV